MPIYEYKGQQYDIATDDPAAAKSKILNYLGSQTGATQTPAPAPQGERTWGEAAADVGASGVSGLGKLIQFPGQLVGLATGAIGEEDFGTTGVQGVGKAMQDWAKEQQSPELKRRVKATEAKVKEAEKTGGQWEAFKTQFGEVVKDPAQLGSFLAEQVPASIPSILAAMIPGAGPALAAEVRTLQAAAQAATTVAAKQAAEKALGEAVKKATASAVKRGTAASVGTGATQQGTDVGAETFEQNYKYLIKQGFSKEEAAAEVINKARAAGASGAIISLLAQRLPGAQAMERALAGEKGKLGRTVGAVVGAAKESPGEIVEEVGGKFTQNVAAREFNPEQSLTQGLGQAGASAALGATFMGGTVGAIQQGGAPTEAQTTQTPPPPAGTQQQTPEQKAQVLRPLEEIEKAEIEKVTQELLSQNFPEDNARSIAVKRVIENRKRQAREAVLEPAQDEVEQRVKDLIDAGVDPKLASIQAPEQIRAEKEADALAQSETQGETNVRQPVTTPVGTSNAVPNAADQTNATAGLGETQRDGVVSNQPNVGQPNVGKNAQPATVVREGTMAAADLKTKRDAAVKKYEEQGFAPADAQREADVEMQQAAAEVIEAPAETNVAPTELSEQDKADLQAELDAVNNADPDEQAFIAEQVATTKKKRAPGGGRKPLSPEAKAAKAATRKEQNNTTDNRRFSKNKNNLLAQLEAANQPLDEGEFENEDAIAQAEEDKRAEKAYVINQMLDMEEANRGTALGNRVKKVLNDRTKISQQELDKVKKGREVRKNTNAKELIGGVNNQMSPSEGTYTTGPKFSQARKNTVRKVNPKITGVMNGAQALTIIAKSGSWFQKLLANRLRQFVPNLRVVVLEKGQALPARLTRAGESPEGRWNGLFMPGTDPVIYITGASFGESNGQNNVTLLHEILHAALNNRLYAGMAGLNPKAKQFTSQVIRLMELARTSYERMESMGLVSDALRTRVESTIVRDEETGEIDYEIFTSPDEFLSYALTEDSVQDFLGKIKGLDKPINKVATAFTDFVRAAAKVLGIGTGKDGNLENSALLDLIDVTDKLLAAPISPELLNAIDETAEGEVFKSTPEKPEKPMPSASVLPDEFKDPVRSAAELKKDTDKAIETVAVSRAGEEGKGIEMMQMARDPEKVLPILQTLVRRNWLNMTNGAISQLVKMPTMTFLAKWSGIKSLQDVDKHMQSMLGMSNSLQAAAGNILASFKKELNPLFRGAKEFRTNFEDLIYTSTVARVDPSNPKAKEKDARVTELYNKVGPKGQEMFRQLKQYYENLVDLYSDLLDDQIKAIQGMTPAAKENLMKVLRQTFETGARITPYFPLVRRGDYWLRVSEKVGKETVQAFYMFESVGERDQYASELAAKKLDDVGNLVDNGTFDMGDTIAGLRAKTQESSDMLTQVFDAIDQEKFDSPEAKEALKDAIYQVYLNTMPEQKFRSQFIHRKDRAGFSTDVLRNISTTAASTSIHLAKLKYSPLLRNALSAANDVAKADPNLSPFVTEAKERVALALESGKPGLGDAVAGVANKASFFWFLSGASSALIQPASIYISALPILAANHNNAIAAGKELGKMLTYITQYSVTRENPDGTTSLVAPSIVNSKSMTDLERDAIRQMSQRGVTQSTYASEVYGYKSIPTAQASTVLGKTKELGKEAADLLVGSLMHNTERLTREAVYLASYRLGVKRGLSHDAAINQAVEDVNEALGNYDVTNRPRFMQQGIGKMLTQFKMFPLHVTMIMATNFVKMLPILNKEGKKAAATKFFGTYLTAGSIAGLAGVPGFSMITGVLAEVFKTMQGDDADDELKDLSPNAWFRYVFLQDKLGDISIGSTSVADLLDSGPLNAITGAAIAERIGLNDLWGRDTKEAKTNREGMLAYVTDKMGPSVSLALSFADAFDAFAVGDDTKAWDKLSPAAIRNIRYTMRLADEGIKDSRGNEVVPPDEISTGRFIAQSIGFRPAEVARMADINYQLTGAQIKIQNEQTRLMTEAKVAIRKQDEKGFERFEEVMEKVDKFNQRHPTYEIDANSMLESIMDDLEKRAGAQYGVNVDEKNAVFTTKVLDYLDARIEREAKARKK